jgi:hypothetical protein
MIKLLGDLLGKMSRGQPAKKPTPPKPSRPISAGDFRAVSITPSLECCAAAMRARGKPYLLREAPRLPLDACTMPTNCSCKFHKNADRRDGDRRLFGATETNHWYAGPDNRRNSCRRSTGR